MMHRTILVFVILLCRLFLPCDAMLMQYMSSLCVCLCVTLWYSIKTAKHRIMQTKQHNSPGILVFVAKDHGKIQMGSLSTGATNAGGVG